MKAPLVPVTLAFLAGILVGTALRLPPGWFAAGGVLSAGVALWWRKRVRSATAALLLLWMVLGALRMAVWEEHPDMGLQEVLSDEPQPVQLHGLVVDDPVELFEPGEVHSTEETEVAGSLDRQICVIALRHRKTAHGWQPIAGRVRVTVHSPRQLLRYGDEILVEGQWSLVPSPGNPGQYDWRASLARKRIHGLLRVRPYDGLVVLRSGQGHPVLAAVFRLRHRWERLIKTHFSEQDAGLLLGLLLGQRAEIDEELKRAFVETGTIHLLVVSGFNVGLVALLIELALRLMGVPWRIRLALSAVALGGYSVVTGLQPPVVRATLMAWVVLGGLALDRIISWLNTLAVAALAILLVDPAQLLDPGFQLSFGAVLSLILFAPSWHRWLELRVRWLHPPWFRRYLTMSVSATTAVWVGLAPLLSWYFHLVAPVSMLANVLLTPLMSLLITAGTGLLLLATIWAPILEWSRAGLQLLLEATIVCVRWCQGLPGGHWATAQSSAGCFLIYYALMGVSMMRERLGWRVTRMAMCWALGVVILGASSLAYRALERRWLRVDILDVGHGDSIVLRTPGGRTLLVDAGSREAGQFVVVPFLRAAGIGTVDALILTHPDEDHLGGAIPLLHAVRVRQLLTNGVRDDTMSARELRRVAAAQGIPEHVLSAGMAISDAPDVHLDVLHPPRGLVSGVAPASNDNSVILKVTKGLVSVLLTGDIEEDGLPQLSQQGSMLRSTVLKVPHHGSRLGRAGELFFDAVHAQVAVLSVGRVHRLPARETLEALSQRGTRLYLTRDHGAVSLRTGGQHLMVRTFRTKQQSVVTP